MTKSKFKKAVIMAFL